LLQERPQRPTSARLERRSSATLQGSDSQQPLPHQDTFPPALQQGSEKGNASLAMSNASPPANHACGLQMDSKEPAQRTAEHAAAYAATQKSSAPLARPDIEGGGDCPQGKEMQGNSSTARGTILKTGEAAAVAWAEGAALANVQETSAKVRGTASEPRVGSALPMMSRAEAELAEAVTGSCGRLESSSQEYGSESIESDDGSSISAGSLQQFGYGPSAHPKAFTSSANSYNSSLLSSVGGVALDILGSGWGNSTDIVGATSRQQLRHEDDVCFFHSASMHACTHAWLCSSLALLWVV
jgi:hypothetical protein